MMSDLSLTDRKLPFVHLLEWHEYGKLYYSNHNCLKISGENQFCHYIRAGSQNEQEEGVMRKKRVMGMLAAGCAAILMLSGFDSSMTTQELLEKSQAAVSQVNAMVIEMEGNASASMKISSSAESEAPVEVPVNGSFELYLNLSMEPFRMGMEVAYDGEAMGQGASGAIGYAIVEEDDGTGTMYMTTETNGEGSGWIAQKADAQTLSQMKETMRSSLSGDVSAIGSNPTFNGTSVDVEQINALMQQVKEVYSANTQVEGGSDTYSMTTVMTGDQLVPIVGALLSASGQTVDDASLQMVQTVMSGIRMKVYAEYNAVNFLPVMGEIDMSESDFSAISSLLVSAMSGGQGGMGAEIAVDELNLVYSVNCEDPEPLTIPQEALDAAASGTDSAPADGTDDATGGIEDLIGQNLTGGADSGSDGTDITTGTDTTDSTGGTDDDEFQGVQNPDGTYYLEYTRADGTVNKVNVAVPNGMRPSYMDVHYASFTDDSYKNSVSYSTANYAPEEETLLAVLDTSYQEENSDYTDVVNSGVQHLTLDNGTVVNYGSNAYIYKQEYRMGATYATLNVGGSIVLVEIQNEDDQYNFVEADEAQVKEYCSLLSPAA